MESVLEKLHTLLDDLIITKAYLSSVNENLKKTTDPDEWEELYEKQFMLSMKMSGIHGDIHKIAERDKHELNELAVRRIVKEADKIFKPLVVEV